MQISRNFQIVIIIYSYSFIILDRYQIIISINRIKNPKSEIACANYDSIL